MLATNAPRSQGVVMNIFKATAIFSAMLLAGATQAATVAVGDGIQWSWSSADIGSSSGQIMLHGDVSGSTLGDVYLQGFQLKKADSGSSFDVSSASVTGFTWSQNELSANGCSGGGHDFNMCFFGDQALSVTDNSNIDLVINFAFSSGVLDDALHLKVQWVTNAMALGTCSAGDDQGSKCWNKVGTLISEDVTAVPLPGTLGLLGLGLAGLGAIRRRKDAA